MESTQRKTELKERRILKASFELLNSAMPKGFRLDIPIFSIT
jgi:hypothetical protein